MRNDLIAAAVCLPDIKGDVETNLAEAIRRVRERVAAGAELVVLPEAGVQGYPAGAQTYSREQITAWAEPVDGPSIRALRELAAELSIHLVAGYDRIDGGDLYNTAELIGPDGAVIGRYDKTHTLSGGDVGLYEPGADLPVFDTPWGGVGILICNDRVYAETWRVLMLRGARMVLIPSNGSYNDGNTRRLQTMAVDNGVACLFAHPRRGLVIDPHGGMVDHDEDEARQWAQGVVDLSRVEESQRGIRGRRRTHLYGDVLSD
jgi:beta-ureidopropionase